MSYRLGSAEEFGTARLAHFSCMFGHDFDAIGLQDCVRISCIFVGRGEVYHTTDGALLEIVHQVLDVFFDPFAWNYTHDQLVLGVQRNRVPVIAESPIIRIIGVTVFFLLADEGPFFVELDLAGLRGKKATSSSWSSRAWCPANRM